MKENETFDLIEVGDVVMIFKKTEVLQYDISIHAFELKSTYETLSTVQHAFWYPANAPPFNIEKPTAVYHIPDTLGEKFINFGKSKDGMTPVNIRCIPILSKEFTTTGKIIYRPGSIQDYRYLRTLGLNPIMEHYIKPEYYCSMETDNEISRALKTTIFPRVLSGRVLRIFSKSYTYNANDNTIPLIKYRDHITLIYTNSGVIFEDGRYYTCVLDVGGSSVWVPAQLLMRENI